MFNSCIRLSLQKRENTHIHFYLHSRNLNHENFILRLELCGTVEMIMLKLFQWGNYFERLHTLADSFSINISSEIWDWYICSTTGWHYFKVPTFFFRVRSITRNLNTHSHNGLYRDSYPRPLVTKTKGFRGIHQATMLGLKFLNIWQHFI